MSTEDKAKAKQNQHTYSYLLAHDCHCSFSIVLRLLCRSLFPFVLQLFCCSFGVFIVLRWLEKYFAMNFGNWPVVKSLPSAIIECQRCTTIGCQLVNTLLLWLSFAQWAKPISFRFTLKIWVLLSRNQDSQIDFSLSDDLFTLYYGDTFSFSGAGFSNK